MAICARIDPATGALVADASNVTQCPGYVLLEPYEYQALGPSFQPYDWATGGSLFGFFFSLPLILFMVARPIGVMCQGLKWW